jgi:hypothetical protein
MACCGSEILSRSSRGPGLRFWRFVLGFFGILYYYLVASRQRVLSPPAGD